MWPGMWEFPTFDASLDAPYLPVLKNWIRYHFGLVVEELDLLDEFTHPTTHRTIKFSLWKGQVIGGRLRRGVGRWRRLNDLDALPLPNPQRRAVDMLLRVSS